MERSRVNKIVPLDELPSLVEAGSELAIGGAWMANRPMAAIRELVRAEVGDLHVLDSLAAIEADLLVGAGLVRKLTFSMVSLEVFGLAPNFRRGVESGELAIREASGVALNVAFDAGARRLPFLPMKDLGGSSLPQLLPDLYESVVCPFTAERLMAIRGLRPDVAVVHALRADPAGNCQVDGPIAIDPDLARSADRVIVTCEEIVDRETITGRAASTHIPGFIVDAVIEAPFGAHPTTHVPRYALDAWQLEEYADAAKGPESWGEHLAVLAAESEDEYRERVLPAERRAVLAELARSAGGLGRPLEAA